MRKITSFVLMIILSFGFTFAQSISQNEAENIAKTFLVKSSSTSLMQRAPAKIDLELAFEKIDNEKPSERLIYVYNIKGGNGFVLVSADKRTKKILGYSKTGSFDSKNIPTNFSYWLNNYAKEIVYAKENLPEVSQTDFSKSMSRVAQKTTSVAPLLGTISYNQGAPYNDECPKKDGKRTATGCVATAMVQVMKYYNWPEKGKSHHSYKWNKSVNLSINFSRQTYDWTKIKSFYNSNSTDEQKAEIAKLMYHAGVSVDMQYDLASNGGSGAQMPLVANALYKYFNYDGGIQVYYRDYFSLQLWNQKIREELDHQRPVIYAGQGTDGGHAFVCDGYDDTGKFHINWGWGGLSNGYFETTALAPNGLGIGGGSGGFNSLQHIITGIQKPVENSKHIQVLGMDGFNNIPTEVDRKSMFSLTVEKLFNIGSFTYKGGAFELALMQDDVFIERLKYIPLGKQDLKSGYGTNALNLNDILILGTVQNGNYQIVFRYKNENGDMVPLLVKKGGIKQVNLEITDDKLKFTSSKPVHNTSLVEKFISVTKLYHNRVGHIKLKLANTGTDDYNSQIGVKLVNKEDNTITQELYQATVGIPMGTAEKEISILGEITVPVGDYYLEIYYDDANDIANTAFPTTLLEPNEHNRTEVAVLETPKEEPELSSSNFSMPKVVKKREDFYVTVDITNNGGISSGDISAAVFHNTVTKTLFGTQALVLDKDQTRSVRLRGNLKLPKGNYEIGLFYKGKKGWEKIGSYHKFKLIENSTDLNDINKDELLVSVNANSLRVKMPEDNLSIKLFNITGKLIYQKNNVSDVVEIPTDKLRAGIFLLQVIDKNNNSVIRKISLTK